MTEILVLLGLLSIATLAARRGAAAFYAHFVATPLLLAAGYIVSPAALGLLTPTTIDGLSPAMRVGAAWLALLLGMRGVRPAFTRQYLTLASGAVAVALFTWAALGALALAGIYSLAEFGLSPVESGELPAVGAALLVSGMLAATGLSLAVEGLQQTGWSKAHDRLLFLARHDDVIGAFAICAAVWLWPVSPAEAPIYGDPLLAAALVIGFGVLLAASHALNHGLKVNESTLQPVVVALIGLIVFAGGMSTSTHLPEAPTAFFLGATLGILGLGLPMLERGLTATAMPVRIVLLVLVGSMLDFSLGPVLLGSALALGRLMTKLGARLLIAPRARKQVPPGAVVGAPTTALAFALSFALSRPDDEVGNAILLTVAVAVSLTDLFTLLVWRRQPKPEELPAADEDAS